MQVKKLYFTFDFISPFSYLAWVDLNRKLSFFDQQKCTVILRPVMMAKIIKEYQEVGHAEIIVKRDYLTRECLRIATRENIPFNCPVKLPFFSLDLLRSVCGITDRTWQWKVCDHFFNCVWNNQNESEDASFLLKQLEDFPEQLWSEVLNKENRRILKKNTQIAISEKIFGVPSFSYYLDDKLEEIFWGRSAFSDLEATVSGTLSFPEEKWKDFTEVFSSQK